MILYSKSGNFLGIGKDELSFLGYEDLEEFKSINSDVADLFVNKPGYIFKFKNFSWIDYALHSGAPKKSVIIKLKTGNEVEVALKIKELFLYSPQENDDIYYAVEFLNNLTQDNTTQNEANFIQTIPTTPIKTSQDIQNPTLEIKKTEEKEYIPKEISFEEDFAKDKDDDLSVHFDEDMQKEDPSLKIKMVDNILQTEEIPSTTEEMKKDSSENFINDYKIDNEIPKLKIDIEKDFVYEEKEENKIIEPQTIEKIDFRNDITAIEEIDFKSNTNESGEESIDFDLLQCIEELGLDIALVGELITEYMKKIDETIPTIKTSIEQNSKNTMKDSIYELKGVSDNLHMHQISDKLEKILIANDQNSQKEELVQLEKIVERFKEELK